MSARSGSMSAVMAAQPAMAIRWSGDVGWCPSYSTLLAAGPETPVAEEEEAARCEPLRWAQAASSGDRPPTVAAVAAVGGVAAFEVKLRGPWRAVVGAGGGAGVTARGEGRRWEEVGTAAVKPRSVAGSDDASRRAARELTAEPMHAGKDE